MEEGGLAGKPTEGGGGSGGSVGAAIRRQKGLEISLGANVIMLLSELEDKIEYNKVKQRKVKLCISSSER